MEKYFSGLRVRVIEPKPGRRIREVAWLDDGEVVKKREVTKTEAEEAIAMARTLGLAVQE